MRIIQRPSPNFNRRPAGTRITAIVLHADAGSTEEGALSWICTKHPNPDDNVSYNYLISRDSVVYQCVADADRAWHAGRSSFRGRANCNDYALGVAFANNQKGEAFTEAAIDAGVELCALLCLRHNIPLDRITTHAVVSPGRKTDPGPLFSLATFVARVKAELSNG
jgi:N-acetylmuramoyl-L-alanine amidase